MVHTPAPRSMSDERRKGQGRGDTAREIEGSEGVKKYLPVSAKRSISEHDGQPLVSSLRSCHLALACSVLCTMLSLPHSDTKLARPSDLCAESN